MSTSEGGLLKIYRKRSRVSMAKIIASAKIGPGECTVWTARLGVRGLAAAMKAQREKLLSAGFEELI